MAFGGVRCNSEPLAAAMRRRDFIMAIAGSAACGAGAAAESLAVTDQVIE